MQLSKPLAGRVRAALALALIVPGAPLATAGAGGDRPGAGPVLEAGPGITIRSEDGAHKMSIRGRIQARFTYERFESGNRDSAFSIPRARIQVKGHAFSKDLGYKLQVDFGKGAVVLKDAMVDHGIVKGRLHLRVGQYKKPFSRQQITSSSRLVLVDRAITDEAFGAGRDIGVLLHNGYEHSPTFEWALGLFNGTGDKPRLKGKVRVDPATGAGAIDSGKLSNVPEDVRPLLALRLGYNHGGIRGYSEGDLEGGPLRFAVAGGAMVDFDAAKGEASSVRAQVDGVIKVSGFSLDLAGYLGTKQDGSGFGDQAISAWGAHAQAGYVFGGRFMPVLRFARVDPRGADNGENALSVGVTLFAFGHSVKWNTDATMIGSEAGGGRTDWQARTQLQLYF